MTKEQKKSMMMLMDLLLEPSAKLQVVLIAPEALEAPRAAAAHCFRLPILLW